VGVMSGAAVSWRWELVPGEGTHTPVAGVRP